MHKFLAAIACVLIFLSTALNVLAIYDPTDVTNNKFGIHIADTTDLEDAAKLVNSTGGDWGYVTFVIQKGEKDIWRWQKVFDRMRQLHLIPIVRIATRGLGEIWEKPSFGEIDGWVSFLNSLNWVIKNRYVIIGNEPNHAKEWGGEINPEEYATYLKEFSSKLKVVSPDFFVLPAGFDASAPKSKETEDEVSYLKRMLAKEPDIFDHIDGWTSHSYPNPGFTGSDNGFGRGTVRTFDWELSLLKTLGVKKDFKVFITETGWVHDGEGILEDKFKNAYSGAWSDKAVVAVTPFILAYQEPPFEVFSWKNKDGKFFDFYYQVQDLEKQKGEPLQETKGEILALFVPGVDEINSKVGGIALVKNTGQSIWNPNEVSLLSNYNHGVEIANINFSDIKPQETGIIHFNVLYPKKAGDYTTSLTLSRKDTPFSNSYNFDVIAITPINMKIQAIFDTIVRYFKGLGR